MQESDREAIDPRAWLDLLKRRWWVLVAASVAGALLLAGLSATEQKIYGAQATILLRDLAPDATNTNGLANPRLINNELVMANSGEVRAAAAKAYGGPGDVNKVTVEATSAQADAVVVSARGTDPAETATLANAYAQAFIDLRREQRVTELTNVGNDLSSRISGLEQNVSQLQAPLDDLDAQIAAATGSNRATLVTQRASLAEQVARERAPIDSQIAYLRTQLDQTTADRASLANGASIVDRATAPTSPRSPKPIRNAIGGFALGLIAGAGIVALLERLDDRVRDVASLQRAAPALPMLAIIPSYVEEDGRPVAIHEPAGAVTEAFRSLRTSIRFASIDRPTTVIAVTSSVQGEGKSTVSTNLGVLLAQTGLRVVVVSCDLRRPSLHRMLGVDATPGFTSVILDELPLAEALQPAPGVPGLDVLASGSAAPNPSELLGSARATAVFNALRAAYDIVILDMPPVLPVSDALVAGRCADCVVVVARMSKIDRGHIARTVDQLTLANLPVLGVVANAVPAVSGYAGYAALEYVDPTRSPRRRRRGDRARDERTAGAR